MIRGPATLSCCRCPPPWAGGPARRRWLWWTIRKKDLATLPYLTDPPMLSMSNHRGGGGQQGDSVGGGLLEKGAPQHCHQLGPATLSYLTEPPMLSISTPRGPSKETVSVVDSSERGVPAGDLWEDGPGFDPIYFLKFLK